MTNIRLYIHRGFIVMVVMVVLLMCAACGVPSSNRSPEAVQGTLDLTRSSGDRVFTLDGEWGFYWNRFIDPEQADPLRPDAYVTVPKAWHKYELPSGNPDEKGHATYTLHVRHAEPKKVWALDISAISSAYSLWVDGKLLQRNGEASSSPGDTRVHIEQRTVMFEPAESTFDIVMQFANDMHPRGGITRSIRLGEASVIEAQQQKRLSFEMFLSGALFIMAVYHLGLYLMRRKDKASFYFGVYCFIIAFRSMLVGETILVKLIPSLSWVAALKLEYLCLSVGVYAFTQFVREIYPRDIYRTMHTLIAVACAAYSAVIAGSGPHIFTQYLVYFQYMIIVFVSYGLGVFLLAIIRRREGAVLSGIGAAVLIGTIINDILYYRGLIPTGNYVTLGLFAFVVAQSFILAMKFSKSFASSEDLANKLQGLNNSLELKVKERTYELEQKNELLRVQSSIDGLTGIANRRYLDETLQVMLSSTMKEGGTLSLLLIDIDHFKAYNDTYGHLQGDECLKRVAQVLQNAANVWDGLAARYGGEEFAVIALVDSSKAAKLAESLVNEIRGMQIAHRASDSARHVTISCGVATLVRSDDSLADAAHAMKEAADEALYRVKKRGRNGYALAERDASAGT